MGTPREQIAKTYSDSTLGPEWWTSLRADGATRRSIYATVDAFLTALGIPLPVLEWASANPEAAKGLAEGTWLAVRESDAADLLGNELDNYRACACGFVIDKRMSAAAVEGAHRLAASTPVTSDEAQGET